MHIDPKVKVTKVRNGYLVDLKPDKNPEPSQFLEMIPGLVKSFLKKIGQEDEDPVMAELQDNEEEEEEEEGSSLLIFKTYPEVSAFLMFYFEK